MVNPNMSDLKTCLEIIKKYADGMRRLTMDELAIYLSIDSCISALLNTKDEV